MRNFTKTWDDDLCIQHMLLTMVNTRAKSKEYGLWLPGYTRTIPSIMDCRSTLLMYPSLDILCTFPIPENSVVDRGYGGGLSLYRPLFFCEMNYSKINECKRRLNARKRWGRKRKMHGVV